MYLWTIVIKIAKNILAYCLSASKNQIGKWQLIYPEQFKEAIQNMKKKREKSQITLISLTLILHCFIYKIRLIQ